jgi:hypothetical protein
MLIRNRRVYFYMWRKVSEQTQAIINYWRHSGILDNNINNNNNNNNTNVVN